MVVDEVATVEDHVPVAENATRNSEFGTWIRTDRAALTDTDDDDGCSSRSLSGSSPISIDLESML